MTQRVLFLNPPSYEGFDGGAGSRYQARREIRSFWYPTWLAQPAAATPGSKLIDAPAHDQTLEDVLPQARNFDLLVCHTSAPSFENDVRVCEAFKRANPALRVGMVGAHVAVLPAAALKASDAVEFVCRKEFDLTVRRIAEGAPYAEVRGVSWRTNGEVHHNPDAPTIEDLDTLPHVVDIYARDLTVEKYYIGYLLHPYVSLYTGRGCPARCTFCLWPQTIGGHTYRTRSPDSVEEEMAKAKRLFPQVKEFFFDDDTFTADVTRAKEIARRLKRLGLTWSCNARANVPYEHLKVLKDCGLRLLLVGYESGNQAMLDRIKKGVSIETARRFTRDCRKLGIKIHGTFILGLPLETRQSIQDTIDFACDIDPDTIQVSLAAAYPGTELYKQAMANGWFRRDALVNRSGWQEPVLEYPGMPASEISEALEAMYRKFYFRPRPIVRILKEMLSDGQEFRRRIREGMEFLKFMRERRGAAS